MPRAAPLLCLACPITKQCVSPGLGPRPFASNNRTGSDAVRNMCGTARLALLSTRRTSNGCVLCLCSTTLQSPSGLLLGMARLKRCARLLSVSGLRMFPVRRSVLRVPLPPRGLWLQLNARVSLRLWPCGGGDGCIALLLSRSALRGLRPRSQVANGVMGRLQGSPPPTLCLFVRRLLQSPMWLSPRRKRSSARRDRLIGGASFGSVPLKFSVRALVVSRPIVLPIPILLRIPCFKPGSLCGRRGSPQQTQTGTKSATMLATQSNQLVTRPLRLSPSTSSWVPLGRVQGPPGMAGPLVSLKAWRPLCLFCLTNCSAFSMPACARRNPVRPARCPCSLRGRSLRYPSEPKMPGVPSLLPARLSARTTVPCLQQFPPVPPGQYAGVSGHSAVSATMDWLRTDAFQGAELDLRKAFDTVNHRIAHRGALAAGVPVRIVQYLSRYIWASPRFCVVQGVPPPHAVVPCTGLPAGDPCSPSVLAYVLGPWSRAVQDRPEIQAFLYVDDRTLVQTGEAQDEEEDSLPGLCASRSGLTASLGSLSMKGSVNCGTACAFRPLRWSIWASLPCRATRVCLGCGAVRTTFCHLAAAVKCLPGGILVRERLLAGSVLPKVLWSAPLVPVSAEVSKALSSGPSVARAHGGAREGSGRIASVCVLNLPRPLLASAPPGASL